MARRSKNSARAELTPEQQAEAQRIHAALLEAAAGDLRELAEELARTTDATIFGPTEFTVRDIAMRVAAKAIQSVLAERRGYDGSSRTCPNCSESARFQRWRTKTLVTAVGRVCVERAYYHCRHCRSGHCPRDTRLGLDGSALQSRGVGSGLVGGGLLQFCRSRDQGSAQTVWIASE